MVYYVEVDTGEYCVGDTLPLEGVIEVTERPNYLYKWNDDIKLWELDKNLAMNEIRVKRNDLLVQTDWTQLLDVDLSEDKKTAWKLYRQALRDITKNIVDVENPTWPIIPE